MAATHLADEALSGFTNSAAYDEHRPSYPQEAVEQLLSNLGVNSVANSTILDLAAGTGKFTELLAQRAESYRVIAVEPHDEMRGQLEKKSLSNVAVKSGLASSIPLVDESVDAVVAAQAFHWFANEESLKEIHRVLKPYGSLGMIWNIEDYNQTKNAISSTVWEGKLRDFIWTFSDDQPRFRHGKWREVFENQIKSNPFSITTSADPLFSLPLGEHEMKWTVWLPKEGIWKRFRTLSQIAMLEGKELEAAKMLFDDALAGDDVQKNKKGEVALHGVTYLAWASKVPA